MTFFSTEKLFPYNDPPDDLVAEGDAIIQRSLNASAAEDHPVFKNILGIPYSGKSIRAREVLLGDRRYTFVSFDNIMTLLKGYRPTHQTQGAKEARRQWHDPARDIGYRWIQTLIENNRSILFENSGCNEWHIPLLAVVRRASYLVQLEYLPCELQTALERVRAGNEAGHRYVPEALVRERHRILPQRLPTFQALAHSFETIHPVAASAEKAPKAQP